MFLRDGFGGILTGRAAKTLPAKQQDCKQPGALLSSYPFGDGPTGTVIAGLVVMAAEEPTEQATPRRRQKAREEGQVAQSKDLTGAVSLAAAVVVYKLAGAGIGHAIMQAVGAQFAAAESSSFTAAALVSQASRWLLLVARAVLPVALAAMAAGVTAGMLQTGFVVSTKKLSPTADKLNPIEGLKRIFSLNGVVEAAKGCLKVALVAAITWQVFSTHKTDVLNFQQMELSRALACMSDIIFEFGIKYCLALLIIGGADYGYQRWQYEKQLRMSRHEVRREMKDIEGDPLIRAKQRQRRRALLQQGISAQMPQADVVVTNPTHLAVALLYRDGQMPAPQVVAKGRGAVAARIKALARAYGIPTIEEPAVARALYETVQIGDFVPPVLYRAVAEILAGIYRAAAERRARRLARFRQQGRPYN